jgi:membrane-associated phospholipid phosphatase
MLFAVVYLGEHYAVDGFAGLAVAAAAWVGVRAFLARRQGSAGETGSASAAVSDELPQAAEPTPQVSGR